MCGGASVRMGRDKASIGDPPWAHRVASALAAAGCAPVELQGGVDCLATPQWAQVPDLAPGGGPVPAIVQASARHRGGPLVLAACDLPALTPSHVTRLLDAVTAGHERAAAYRLSGRANWSLVALHPDLVADFATMGAVDLAGSPLHALLPRDTALLDPQDPVAVTDIDEPT